MEVRENLFHLIRLYLSKHEFFGILMLRKQHFYCLLIGSVAYIFSGKFTWMKYVRRVLGTTVSSHRNLLYITGKYMVTKRSLAPLILSGEKIFPRKQYASYPSVRDVKMLLLTWKLEKRIKFVTCFTRLTIFTLFFKTWSCGAPKTGAWLLCFFCSEIAPEVPCCF